METVIISCRTIELEVLKAMRETGLDCPVFWVDSGLHDRPKKLHIALQELLNDIQADRVILALGFCGNSIEGLTSGKYELLFPKVDDCISLLLGSMSNRRNYERTYFLTRGWLEGERNIYEEYKHTIKRYGPEVGGEIMEMLLGQYRDLAILDTGTVDYPALLDETAPIAEALHLRQVPGPATDVLLKQLLTGPWPEEKFCVLPPYSTIRISGMVI